MLCQRLGKDVSKETYCAERHAIIADLPLMYPGASEARKLSVPAMLPAQYSINVKAFVVTFFECPPRFDAFQTSKSMKACNGQYSLC